MHDAEIGLLHPGEMGAAVGGCLAGLGHTVRWASAGRGAATAARARHAGLADAGSPQSSPGAAASSFPSARRTPRWR